MISAKTLSGDIITLEATNEEEFEQSYKEKYIKENHWPFVSVKLIDNMYIIVNVYNIIPIVNDIVQSKMKGNNYEFLDSLKHNKHIKAIEFYEECLKSYQEKNVDENEYLTDLTPYIISNEDTFTLKYEYIDSVLSSSINSCDLSDNVQLILYSLAKNTSNDAIDILNNFINENIKFIKDKTKYYSICEQLFSNSNPKAFDIIEIMIAHEITKPNYWRYTTNPTVIKYIEKNKPNLFDFYHLSSYGEAMDILLKNKDKINFQNLCENNHPIAVDMILEVIQEEGINSSKIDHRNLFKNKSKKIMDHIYENMQLYLKYFRYYSLLLENEYAIKLILKIEESCKFIQNLQDNRIFKNKGIFRDDEDIYL
jgi:hypothetical protein